MIPSVHEAAAGNHPLTDEQRQALRDGGMAHDFLQSQAWAMLEQQQQDECYEALRAMYENESSDPVVIAALWRRWKAAEKQRQGFKNRLEALRDDYLNLIEQVQRKPDNDFSTVPTGAESPEADQASL